jgi:hypothetical protein
MNESSSASPPPPPYAFRGWTGKDLPYLCGSSIPNLPKTEKKYGIAGRNSLKPLSNLRTLLHQILQNSLYSTTFCKKKKSNEFHENWITGLAADTKSRTGNQIYERMGGRTDIANNF